MRACFPWPHRRRVMLGHQIPTLTGPGVHSPRILAVMPHHLCTLPPPAWWSWSEGEGAGGARSCADADRHTSASPPVVSPAFAKAFERKGKFCSFFLSFLSSWPCVLPPCSELLCSVHAAQRKPSGCGAAALGIVLIKLV